MIAIDRSSELLTSEHMANEELKTAMLAIRVPPSLKVSLEQIAAQDRRSVASLVEKVLADFVRDYVAGEIDVGVVRRK